MNKKVKNISDYMPTDQYKNNLEKQIEVWLPDDAQYLGMFLCQGNVEVDRRKIIRMCRKTPSLSYGDIRHAHRIYASN